LFNRIVAGKRDDDAPPPASFCRQPAGPGHRCAARARPDRNEQDRARQDLAAGHVRSLREIEARVLPMMRGAQYLGPEYDPQARAYRLKFIREGRVVFVDVDGRTGQVMGESR
jgi:hypothetical protein